MMIVAISDIKIKKRIRKDLGDIDALMESLEQYGLLNPITVNTKNELIAGHRRLEAAKRLGWQNIHAVQIDIRDPLLLLELEMEENMQRLAFSDAEAQEGYAKLEKLRNPHFMKKWWRNIVGFFSDLFSSNAKERLGKKVFQARKYLWLFPIGIFMLIVSGFWNKTGLSGSIFKTLFDLSSLIILLFACFSLVRLIYLKRINEK
ncbi:MAG TPA: ParB N-terminal domain-containing protein [Treponemataceae bacterium]|nr:ParB N-terminal domain-containing protein [Treponemataceae bacterium]